MKTPKEDYCMNCANGGHDFQVYETSVGMLKFCSDYCHEQFEKPSVPTQQFTGGYKVAKGIH